MEELVECGRSWEFVIGGGAKVLEEGKDLGMGGGRWRVGYLSRKGRY